LAWLSTGCRPPGKTNQAWHDLMAKKKPSKASRKLAAKQKRLAELVGLVETGKLRKMETLKRAGYADSTAREQSEVLGLLGNNQAMQAALRNVRVTEERLAEEIDKELRRSGGHVKRGYIELSTRLLDAMPSQKHDVTVHPPQTYAEIEHSPAGTPDEAKERANGEEWGE